ncbi:MAG TPA: ROK family protein [Streptosporangiaceae bacterium]|nr:ROK family protein [Streptosporangiaceae bacterium]
MTPAQEVEARTRPGLSLETRSVIDVFTEVLKRGPIARIDVARRTGLSQSAVTKAIAPLIGRGLLFPDGASLVASQGRPPQPINVNEEAQLVLGIIVRVDEIYGVATTIRANILHSVRRPLPGPAVSTVVDGIAAVTEALLSRLGDAAGKVMGTGVVVSGDIDSETGVVRMSPRMNWSDVPLADLLQARLGMPVVVDNDVRALTIAEEWFGIGVDTDSFAIVTIGTGIGCGLYLNGDVVEGAHGVAGEIGHLPLAPAEIVCSCGRRGCVETVASSAAILGSIREAQRDPGLTLREAVQLARSGNPNAVHAFDRAAALIGMALATMTNLVGPSVILVMGESVTDYDLYEQRIRESFDQHTFGSARQCRIITRSHTFEDWARGAAASVIRTAVNEAIASRGSS